jgi:putative N6-adenine-specific DNA methylase
MPQREKAYQTNRTYKYMAKSTILVTCAKGVTQFLKEEIVQLGFPVVSETTAGVISEGTLDDTLRFNMMLRTGHRVLFLIKNFRARDADALYHEVYDIPWEEYIPTDGYLCVTSSVQNPTIKDTRYANVKCKDAIVDRIRQKYGNRPDSGPFHRGAVVNLYWKDENCSLYLDTSGEPLSKRGYRKIPMTAPMQETLAAAVIKASGWNGTCHFINPMCGSGTLAIEAALLASHRAPGLQRNNFGFMHLRGFDRSRWDTLRLQAQKAAKKTLDFRIIATDIHKNVIKAAKQNAASAGIEHLIEFDTCNYADTNIPDGGGIVMINPEYGERMGTIKQLEAVYKGIGDFFKNKCKGYTGYLFTGNLDLAKKIGLRAKRRIPFFNGRIECRLLEYEIYEGSRKTTYIS